MSVGFSNKIEDMVIQSFSQGKELRKYFGESDDRARQGICAALAIYWLYLRCHPTTRDRSMEQRLAYLRENIDTLQGYYTKAREIYRKEERNDWDKKRAAYTEIVNFLTCQTKVFTVHDKMLTNSARDPSKLVNLCAQAKVGDRPLPFLMSVRINNAGHLIAGVVSKDLFEIFDPNLGVLGAGREINAMTRRLTALMDHYNVTEWGVYFLKEGFNSEAPSS